MGSSELVCRKQLSAAPVKKRKKKSGVRNKSKEKLNKNIPGESVVNRNNSDECSVGKKETGNLKHSSG